MKQDVYEKVTAKIIADLEKGELSWIKPWSSGNMEGRVVRPLRHNGVPYSGINVLMLWGAAIEGGFSSPFWMTFKQAQDLGAHVKKGEKGSLVVYANSITRDGDAEMVKQLQEIGMTLIKVDKAAFKAATQPAVDSIAESQWDPDFYQKVKDALK